MPHALIVDDHSGTLSSLADLPPIAPLLPEVDAIDDV